MERKSAQLKMAEACSVLLNKTAGLAIRPASVLWLYQPKVPKCLQK